MKIVENKNNVDAEILTSMTGSNLQLNQYTKFDQWNLAYDANGNTIQKGTQQFSYNYRNQLVKAVDGGKTFTLKYDPFNRMIEKSGSGNTTRFYYAGNQVIEERNGSDQVLKNYVWGNGIDELLRMDKYTGNTPIPYYFHTNDSGSTTAITDDNGALVERVSYDTFGMPSFTDASGQPVAASIIGNTILFQGHELDLDLNLYNYRARFYDPAMGRFLQTDPVGYKDSMNLYQGMNMNPGNYLDPMGEWYIDVHKEMTNSLYSSHRKELKKYLKNDIVFYDKFMEGLNEGAGWPDMPEGRSGILNVYDIISGKIKENAPKNSLQYRSDYGDLQYWHSMKYGDQTNQQVKDLMIIEIKNWIKKGKDLLDQKASFDFNDMSRYYEAGKLIGMAMHILEDSYCPAHAQRDPETMGIIQFNDYGKQIKKDHKKLDEYIKETEDYYKEAHSQVEEIFKIIFDPKKKNSELELMKILQDMLKLKE